MCRWRTLLKEEMEEEEQVAVGHGLLFQLCIFIFYSHTAATRLDILCINIVLHYVSNHRLRFLGDTPSAKIFAIGYNALKIGHRHLTPCNNATC